MTDTYGALQAASNDAGSWTLIEQGDTGEWAPLARGGKHNIVKLAQLLNTAETLLEKQTDPAILTANLEAVRDNMNNPPAGLKLPPGAGEWTVEQQNMAAGSSSTITRAEVESWDQDRYLQRRARLFYVPRGALQEYRDGSEHGREYTAPAAKLMTGPREDHPAFRPDYEAQARMAGQQLRRLVRAAQPVWTAYIKGDNNDADQRRQWLADNWPELEKSLTGLNRALHADDGPAQS